MPAVGVDVGGSTVAVGALTDEGELVGVSESVLPTREYDALLEQVATQVTATTAALPLGADEPAPVLGLAMAAWLSPDRERILTAANLGWNEREIRRDLAGVTGLATTVHNDGNAAAWGEYLRAGRAPRCLVMLTLGTDVGGGVVAEGRLLTGATSLAGELGHISVSADGPTCVCGATGCLSVYASGPAMARQAGLDGPALAAAAHSGDPAALAVVIETARAIAFASGQISRVVDHDVLVLGGGVSAGLGQLLVEAVAAAVAQAEPVGPIRPRPQVVAARAGRLAGVLGAADLALRAERDAET